MLNMIFFQKLSRFFFLLILLEISLLFLFEQSMNTYFFLSCRVEDMMR